MVGRESAGENKKFCLFSINILLTSDLFISSQEQQIERVKKWLQLRNRDSDHRVQVEERRRKLEDETKVAIDFTLTTRKWKLFCARVLFSRLNSTKYYDEKKNENKEQSMCGK